MKKFFILATGSAGYVGSKISHDLIDKKFNESAKNQTLWKKKLFVKNVRYKN